MCTELFNITTCYVQPIYIPIHHTMKNVGCISADMQARIEPPHIPFIKLEVGYYFTTQIIKVKMRRNLSLAASEIYNINMNTFYDGQLEEFLSLLRKFKIAIDGTETTTPSGRINYLRMMLC